VTDELNDAVELNDAEAADHASGGAQQPTGVRSSEVPGPRGETVSPAARSGASVRDSDFLRACRREPVSHTPVWFMRQAGRSLPEYRKVRQGTEMLESCMRPDLVTEITLQPVRRHGVDAAILYSDITLPLKAIGVDLDIHPGIGPVIANPVRSMRDLDQLRPIDAEADLPYITEAVQQLVVELGATPLIGFGGAPYTVASYLIEGGPSKNHERTKAMMYGEPELFAALLDKIADNTAEFLRVQVAAGASAVQLFDSWAGSLAPSDYQRYVMPHSAKVLAAVADLGVPRIHFGVGTGELLGLMGEAGADVVGVDWRVPLSEAARRVGPGKSVQGNLDPAVLFAGWPVVEAKVREILRDAEGVEGHVFNLGHGVLPEVDPDVLTRIVQLVHEVTAR
jgi:uroporphyrinogen decarboxylase